MSIIGYVVSGHDNGSHMCQGGTQPPRCAACGFVTDSRWVDPAFTIQPARRADVSSTFDNRLIVSDRVRDLVAPFPGALFVDLPACPGWSVLFAEPLVRFDVAQRGTRFEAFCGGCDRYTQVAGAYPVLLDDPPVPLPDQVMRTDVEFGSGDELSPLILVGPGLAHELMATRLTGVEMKPILRNA